MFVCFLLLIFFTQLLTLSSFNKVYGFVLLASVIVDCVGLVSSSSKFALYTNRKFCFLNN